MEGARTNEANVRPPNLEFWKSNSAEYVLNKAKNNDTKEKQRQAAFWDPTRLRQRDFANSLILRPNEEHKYKNYDRWRIMTHKVGPPNWTWSLNEGVNKQWFACLSSIKKANDREWWESVLS